MNNKNAKIERWLENISEYAKNQAIRFLLEDTSENCNKGFILRQVEEFSRMYPDFNSNTFSGNRQQNNSDIDTSNKEY